MLAAPPSRPWQYEQARTARLSQLEMFQAVRRPGVDVAGLRMRLGCAFLRHGWLVLQPEAAMAVVARVAGGPSLN
jgi:hypothetical protein